MQLLLIPALLVGVAWCIAELRGKATLRRVLGLTLAIALPASVVYQRAAERFGANSYFTSAAKELLDGSVANPKQGRTDAVLREWAQASAKFGGTYENRGRFAEVVEAAVAGMRRE